ncbi:MAG: helicase, partial [archaeon]|nr:helicase [archaeon]
DVIPNLDVVEKSQCFPLYYYESTETEISSNLPASQTSLFASSKSENKQYIRKDGISDFILNEAKSKYSQPITKEDIFYYVYGFLHSKEYRTTFSADLKKILARIPLVDNEEDFWAFSRSGRELADLHLHYENVEPYPDVKVTGTESQNFNVQKMWFVKKGDKSSIQYNESITVSNIPLKAYDYVVNGKSAIEWVMERYAITFDKDTHITNDPNDWSKEHENPRYILDLLLKVITVSMKTMEIVENLPMSIELKSI